MQTLKTSIVVCFMLVVLYTAYVTLNAPQNVLTDDLASLTDIETVDVDLGDIPPLDPPPGINTKDPSLVVNPNGTAQASFNDKDTGVSQSLSDIPIPPINAGDLSPLPKPSPGTPGAKPDPQASYPATGSNNLMLPDPSSLGSSSLSSDDKKPAAGKDDLKVPDVGMPPMPALPGSDSASTKPDAKGKDPASNLKNAIATAERQKSEGRLREALFTLSIFYGSPDLSPADQATLLDMLDHLAGEVIYSRGHFLTDAHRVTRGETLQQVSDRYGVPWQLLANINRIDNPEVLLPGTELKVVNGPFRAEVNLTRSEVTLFLGDLYAGRFPITVGQDPAPVEGTYTVVDKRLGREHQSNDGRMIPAQSPENPYGEVYLDLGRKMCLHVGSTNDTHSGCIRLSPVDARDLYGILSQGSPVAIRR